MVGRVAGRSALVSPVTVRIVVAVALAASATDSLIAHFPVVFDRKGERRGDVQSTPGSSLAWDKESASSGTLASRGILLRLCVPLVALGATALWTGTLFAELLERGVSGPAALPELLAADVCGGAWYASVFATVWFACLAIWVLAASASRGFPPQLTRGWVRSSAVVGWLTSAWLMRRRLA